MTNALPLALLLGAAALVAIARYLVSRRTQGASRIALVALQAPIAALLWIALVRAPEPARDVLVVLTADVVLPPGVAPERAVALPEAPADARVERVPDLATALRRHPGASALRVVGAGLVARDRDAARALPLDFEPPPEPAGIVELDAPASVAPGRRFAITGRIVGDGGDRVELRDPGDRVVATAAPREDGRFVLEAVSGPEGASRWRLRRVADGDVARDFVDVTVAAVASPALRVGIAAGSVSPELKYLRRALQDAGHAVASRLTLGGGVEIADAELALDGATLASLDVLVLDERAWLGLGPATRATIGAAVRDGLGVLLRSTGPLDETVRRDWRALGLALEADPDTPPTLAFEGGSEAPPALTTLPWRVVDEDAAPFELAGRRIGAWRPLGLGRIGFWRLADTHRLVTAGHAARHGELWASALDLLARARGAPRPRVIGPARTGERVAICGLGGDTEVEAPDGTRTTIVPDPAADACAGYWPRTDGTHVVRTGGTDDPPMRTPFEVSAHDPSGARARVALAATTRALARAEAMPAAPGTRAVLRYARELALLAAFSLLVLCWVLERRALRRAPPRDAAA